MIQARMWGGIIAGREYFEEQWGLNNTGQDHTSFDLLGNPIQVSGISDADIDAPEGWDIMTGDPSVKIAILDTGIYCNSIEHAGKCVEEMSFVGDYSDYLSLGNLKTCFAYQLEIIPDIYYLTVGVCPVSASAAAITHAADNGYHVINISYGSDQLDENNDPVGPPAQPNTETDAIAYAWSQYGRLNLHGALAFADNDADGIPDTTNPDDDNDGLSDLDEINDIGTDPLVADTDGDDLLGGFEVNYKPNLPDTYTPGQDLNPLAADTDTDGFKDGMEFAAGYDPLDVDDFPVWGDINDDRVVDTVDVLMATRATLGLLVLDDGQLARGNVAPLEAGIPNPPLVDEFNLADQLLIMRKAMGNSSY